MIEEHDTDFETERSIDDATDGARLTTRRRRFMRATGAGVASLATLSGQSGAGRTTQEDDDNSFDVTADINEVALLVVSVTQGYRHQSIEKGNETIRELADRIEEETGASEVTVDVIDGGPTSFVDPKPVAAEFPQSYEELEGYDAVIWNNTTHQILVPDGPADLPPGQRRAFETYIRNGGGYVGVHAAADTHYDWEWYHDLVGAQFENHPAVQEARLTVENREHPSTKHLPVEWIHEDEWYDFDHNPRGDVNVLVTVDEDTYDGAGMEDGRVDHPIAWCQEFQGGRSWYTNLAHRSETWDVQAFREHLLGGILWSAGFVAGDATATVWNSYKQREITTDAGDVRGMDAAPDGRIFAVQREGDVVVINPDGVGDFGVDTTTTVLEREFWSGNDEAGGLGIALDPDFASNGYLYLYYAPTEAGLNGGADGPYNVLSRFAVSDGTADPASEVELLRVPQQREQAGLQAGDLQFGPGGDLYISTGDGVSPDPDGYAPLDERSSPNATDAGGTAADSADLRGSVLRISPNADGTYDVPSENLFVGNADYPTAVEDGRARAEIYALGLRKPVAFDVDDETGWLYLGDFGPTAGDWDEDRGPIGIGEFTRIREAGNYGWPHVRGPGYPYVRCDYESGESGDFYDPDGPQNDSSNNDGVVDLPAVDPASLYVPVDWDTYTSYGSDDENQGPVDTPDASASDTTSSVAGSVLVGLDGEVSAAQEGEWHPPDEATFPELRDITAVGGPLVRLPDDTADDALPAYFDGKWILGEADSGNLLVATPTEEGDILEVAPFLPEDFLPPGSLQAMEVGPDGRLYYVSSGDEDTDAGVYQLEYNTADVRLTGTTGGWQGEYPEEIEGETNPTLRIPAGTGVRLEWTNGDGGTHNFEILDEDGNTFVSTEIITEGTQVVEFVADTDMVRYQCNPHRNFMNGEMVVEEEIGGVSTIPYAGAY